MCKAEGGLGIAIESAKQAHQGIGSVALQLFSAGSKY